MRQVNSGGFSVDPGRCLSSLALASTSTIKKGLLPSSTIGLIVIPYNFCLFTKSTRWFICLTKFPLVFHSSSKIGESEGIRTNSIAQLIALTDLPLIPSKYSLKK
jgi:hypothetical protein